MGAQVTVIPPADLAAHSLDPYCAVIIDIQDCIDPFVYTQLDNAAGSVAAYVSGGGTLWFNGGAQIFDTPVNLPGGAYAMLWSVGYTYNNLQVDPGHPIVAGLADPIVGNYANHETLFDLPVGANVILVSENQDPTAAEYAHDLGTVLATCVPAGFYYPGPHDCWSLWLNSAAYILDICGVVVEAEELASGFELAQNHPNPFNPSTSIDFSLTKMGHASLVIYNLAGERVATLADGLMERGEHSLSFDAGELASGIYVYTLQAEDRAISRKMTLIK